MFNLLGGGNILGGQKILGLNKIRGQQFWDNFRGLGQQNVWVKNGGTKNVWGKISGGQLFGWYQKDRSVCTMGYEDPLLHLQYLLIL